MYRIKRKKEKEFSIFVEKYHSNILAKLDSLHENNFEENKTWHRGYYLGQIEALNLAVFHIGRILGYDVRVKIPIEIIAS